MSTTTVCASSTDKARLTRHSRKWSTCTSCPLHKTASKKVYYRGTIPATILFVGEAPGNTEDSVGEPFLGKSGRLLNQLISECLPPATTYGITNIVACRPLDSRNAIRKPLPEEIVSCRPRLEEIIRYANPRMLVLLGAVARDYYPILDDDKTILHLYHPAYILRKGGISSREYDETKRKLLNATATF